jgi:hypothetical protein
MGTNQRVFYRAGAGVRSMKATQGNISMYAASADLFCPYNAFFPEA